MCKHAIYPAAVLFAAFLILVPSFANAFTPFLSFTENPVRLLRNTDFYLASRGAQLESGDIIDSGSADLQLECGSGCTAALGPGSQGAIHFDAKGVTLILLSGWLKIQSRITPTEGAVIARSMNVQVNASGCSLILHKTAAGVELFVESGHPSLEELDGTRVVRRTKFEHDPYGQRLKGRTLVVARRPPKEFIQTIPPVFLNMLLPVPVRTARPSAKRDRSANFSEIAPWLSDEPELRDRIDRRFPRAKQDPGSPSGSSGNLSKARLHALRIQELSRIQTGLEAAKSKPAATPKPAPASAPEAAPSAVQE